MNYKKKNIYERQINLEIPEEKLINFDDFELHNNGECLNLPQIDFITD